ncbi:hypothetical protein AYO40_00405 [Planctomycetaceae bacterium SCGC AG-212-D15]|nr:hypothetical protein AYO40_00405 [Planctomycetaceae bacterium SCGC AG-212-D15]
MTANLRRFATVLAGLLLTGGNLIAVEPLLPADRPIPEVIDAYIDAKLQQVKLSPAPPADEHTLVRRLYLDLAGRIPTADEARAYVLSTNPDRRNKLIESLLGSPEYVRHNATEFDQLLSCGNPDAPSVRAYLLSAFREKRPWDRMFRELLGVAPAPDKPEQFILKRLKDTDMLARDVSSVFFGLNITCAQCHKHPHIRSITQDYFFGMKAFFARSYDFQDNLVERQYAEPVQYKAKNGEMRLIGPMFLDGTKVELPAAGVVNLAKAVQDESKQIQELGKTYAKTKQMPALADFNLRVRLANIALQDPNRERFARAIVNRLWHRFHGYGLVMRLDQMHAENDPSHPELLAWLSRDFIAHHYNLSRLIRGLVSSKTYARSSQWTLPEPPKLELFAVARLRPLTPMQWGLSHRVASNPARLKSAMNDKLLEILEGEARKNFGKLIEQPCEDLQIGITESMKLSNDVALLKLTGDELVPLLLKMPERRPQIEGAVWTVLSRPPTEGEYRLLGTYLEERKDRPADALQQVVWALFNGAEFRFNH